MSTTDVSATDSASLTDAASTREGFINALGAYLAWGFIVFYFKAVDHVPPLEVLAHRIAWSVPLLMAVLVWQGRLASVRTVLRDRRTLGVLLATTVLIAINWLVFILAVFHDQVLQASLGYYINPLVSVLLGMAFLGERLRPVQWLAAGLAVVGVLVLAIGYGVVPWISLLLASSFGLYGLLRKTVRADGLVGLLVETALLLPLCLGYLGYLAATGELVFGQDLATSLLLPAGGVVTAVPLLWFANGVRRLRLSTIGFMQYIAPTMQFLIAVLVFAEPFTAGHQKAFVCIWLAVGLYSADAWRVSRNRRMPPRSESDQT
ncbi:MAG: EamA family transporter RarD [Acidobacteriota bacterium]